MRIRLRSPRQLAKVLITAARRDRREVAEYLDTRPEEWEALAGAAPGDAADILEQLDEEQAAELLSDLDPEDAAPILEEIAPELAVELVEALPTDRLAAVIAEMPGEAAADLILELPEDVAESVLALVDDQTEQEIQGLLVYPHDSAGGLMTTEVAALPLGMTTGEAIERIRQLNDEYEDLQYVYVVDDSHRLKGVISFRDLVFKRPGHSLEEAMVPDPVAVRPFTDREDVAELVQRYHFFSIPVTDGSGRLLGMVTTDAVLEAIQDEASEDFAASVGAGAEETVYTNVARSVRARAPWLMLNLGLALVVAFVVEQLTHVVSREPVLAALMPVVAGLGGNSGQQSLAVVIRSLGSDDVPGSQVASILTRQAGIGVLNGMLLAALAMGISIVLVTSGLFASTAPAWRISLAIGTAVVANLTIASVVGTGIPLLLRRVGLDPALASTIFLTLITDTVGFGGFLLVAGALL